MSKPKEDNLSSHTNGRNVIRFPSGKMDPDVYGTLMMSEHELEKDIKACGINPDEMIEDILIDVNLITNTEESKKSLYSSLKEIKQSLYLEKENFKVYKNKLSEQKKEKISYTAFIHAEFILASFFIIATMIINYYAFKSLLPYNIDFISTSVTSFIAVQLFVILFHKHVSNEIYNKTHIKNFSLIYAFYSCLNMFVFTVGAPGKDSEVLTNFTLTILILLIASMTVISILVSIQIMFDSTGSYHKRMHTQRYGKSGYH